MEVAVQVLERAVPAWIVGDADDIELDSPGDHVVQPEPRLVVLAPESDVHHHRHVGVDGFGPFHACLKETGQLVEITDMTVRPEQSVIDLVPDLHHVG